MFRRLLWFFFCRSAAHSAAQYAKIFSSCHRSGTQGGATGPKQSHATTSPQPSKPRPEAAAAAATRMGSSPLDKTSFGRLPKGAPAGPSSKVADKRTQFWVTPWLIGMLPGKPLTPDRKGGSTISRLGVPADVTRVCYGLEQFAPGQKVQRDVTVLVKVPEQAKEVFREARGSLALQEEGSRVVQPWPRLSVAVVHRFEAALEVQTGRQALVKLSKPLQGLVEWRLFGLEAVSVKDARSCW